MGNIWITDVLESGKVTDNSSFEIVNGSTVLKNDKELLVLSSKPKKRTRREHYLDHAYRFLKTGENELNTLFKNKTELQKRLHFFDSSEYEHNTLDPLFSIKSLDPDNWTLQTGNLVGFLKGNVGKYSYSLNVSSRFGDNFLKGIISDAEGFLEIDDFGGSGGQSDMEWLLIYFWKIKLKKAFRLGIPKSYHSKREVLPTLRGSIDILDYALKGRQTAKYKCHYREHSYVNPVNQLINTTFQKLKASSLLKDVVAIRRAFETAVKGQKLPLNKLQSIEQVKNPYFHPYNEVIDLSRKLLRDEFSDFQNETDTNALFFDVSMLFEYFIRKLVIKAGLYVWISR